MMRVAIGFLSLLLVGSATALERNEETVCASNGDRFQGAGMEDLVTHLPGWDQPMPTHWFSGYLDYEFMGRSVHTHYVLVQAEDDLDGEKPLIYWSNGGPGASSLFGLLTELGPLLLSDDSLATKEFHETGVPSPQYNPYSWSRFGHLLIIDQPAPIGFSYCGEDEDSHSCGGIAWTDELTSLNAFQALQTFFQTKFPCLIDLPFYLTGESYGGIYIPTLARRILEAQEQEAKETTQTIASSISLQGFAVGDGCLGVETTMCGSLSRGDDAKLFREYWDVLFLAGHHQIPLSDFHKVMKACAHLGDDSDISILQDVSELKIKNDQCQEILKQIHTEAGGYFEYALYDTCTYRNGLLREPKGALNDYPCGAGPVLESYLALPEVEEALHVRSTFFEVDNAEGDFDYTPTEPDLSGFYRHVAENTSLRVLVYNGDTDPAITSFATANWTSHLGLEETQRWRPWTVDGCQEMGGYVTRYEGEFDFVTIRGAGHMVPTYKPKETFAFMKAWFDGEDYLTFDPNCTQPATAFEPLLVEKVTGAIEVDVDLPTAQYMRGRNADKGVAVDVE